MKKSQMLIISLTMSWMIFLTGQVTPGNPGMNESVMKAYHLRMDGKVDQAKEMLEGILNKDSNNAMAWYELARLRLYMFTGQEGVSLDDIGNAIAKATELEPDNVIYSYYQSLTCFFKAFMAMQMQQQDQVKPLISETCRAFDRVLSLKPDYCEAGLYLVDIYGMLPKDMGGDSLKALEYAEHLEQENPYYGAKARAHLLPEEADRVSFWKGFLAKDTKNPDLLMETGIACLLKDDPATAETYFREAMKTDPSKNYLVLDMARYHIYKVMQNRDLAKTELPLAKKYLEDYLATVPEPVVPLKAYTKGMIALTERFLGNQEEADKILAEAKALDPYFSRASGIPTLMLFEPPDKVTHDYFSFFSPF